MELEFDDSNISLDIPLPSGVDVNEWSLVPLVLPMVKFVNSRLLILYVLFIDIKKTSRLLQTRENHSIHEA